MGIFRIGAQKPLIKPFVLLVLDGWGIAPRSEGNPIALANHPNFDRFAHFFPNTQLIAAGESVGLPANEAGNSEVGHLTLGSGRIIYQSLPRINMAIEDESFYQNNAFLSALEHIKKFNSKLHIMGLISGGEVHSSLKHFWALLEFCRRSRLKNVSLHLFTDGRDAPPTQGLETIEQIEAKITEIGIGQISTICGRYYAMDRDGRWERTRVAYEAIVAGRGQKAALASAAIQNYYSQGKTDEFIEPTVIIKDTLSARLGPASIRQAGVVDDNDAVIFFNFRIDRPRQLTMAFVFPDFEKIQTLEFGYLPHEEEVLKSQISGFTFERIKKPRNVFFVTMTEYQRGLPVSAIAFPPPKISDSLAEVISKNNLKQLHLAESEKERMISFYFDGMREDRFQGEDVVIIPSPKVATYDKNPEMSVFKLVARFKRELKKNIYSFFVVNFANPDMVAHSGNLTATIKAIGTVDKAASEIVSEVLARGGCVIITADHGNAEELLTFPTTSFFMTTATGTVNTEHSNNPVPLYIISKDFEGKGMVPQKGNLSDVATTALFLMGLAKPAVMTGKNLLQDQIKTDPKVV